MTAQPSQFSSTKKAMVIVARHGHDILHPVTGTKIDEVKRLAAEFGVHRGEYLWENPETGEQETHADIAGFFYDLDADALAKGWSDDEKEAMRRRLIEAAQNTPDFCRIHSSTPAAAPWPRYDSTHHFKIPGLAAELGLVEQALIYEQQTKNRDGVVKALQERLGSVPEPTEPDPEPVEDEELTPAA